MDNSIKLLFAYLLLANCTSLNSNRNNQKQNKNVANANKKPVPEPSKPKLMAIPETQKDRNDIAKIVTNGGHHRFYRNSEMIKLLEFPNPVHFCTHQVDPINIWKDPQHKNPNLLGSGTFGTVYKGIYTPDPSKTGGIPTYYDVAAKYQNYTIVTHLNILQEINFLRIMSRYSRHHMKFYNCFYELNTERKDKTHVVILMMDIMNGDAQGYIKNKKDHPRLKANWRKLRQIFLNMAKGIRDMHWLNIMHRDIKPANYLLNKAGDPIVADLGLATFVSSKGVADVCGTPCFMAPEVVHRKRYNFPGDVYSLGITFYSIIHGTNPDSFVYFHIGNKKQKPVSYPYYHFIKNSRFLGLIQAMTQQDPRKRPTMEQVAISLAKMTPTMYGDFRPSPAPNPPKGMFKNVGRNLGRVSSLKNQKEQIEGVIPRMFRII